MCVIVALFPEQEADAGRGMIEIAYAVGYTGVLESGAKRLIRQGTRALLIGKAETTVKTTASPPHTVGKVRRVAGSGKATQVNFAQTATPPPEGLFDCRTRSGSADN